MTDDPENINFIEVPKTRPLTYKPHSSEENIHYTMFLNLAEHSGAFPRHAGLDPASSSIMSCKSTGFPFDCAQGGESFDFAQDREPVERPVEPRIKSGMTKEDHMQFCQL